MGRVEETHSNRYTYIYIYLYIYMHAVCVPTRRGVDGGQGGAEGGELRPELADAAVGRLAALAHGVADHA